MSEDEQGYGNEAGEPEGAYEYWFSTKPAFALRPKTAL
jgi:hypothetical protein